MSEKDREYTKYREMMYRLLSSIYINEIDENMLRAMQEFEFPEAPAKCEGWQTDLAEGYALIQKALAGFEGKDEQETSGLLEDLAADYARTFLAAGDATGKAAFPYESYYAGTDSRFGGSIQMQLNALYAAKGFQMKKDMFSILEDHIGLEFCYMAELLRMQSGTEDEKEAETLGTELKTFFNEHIAGWIGLFTADIYKYSERDFYRGFARVTRGFAEAEKLIFSGEE